MEQTNLWPLQNYVFLSAVFGILTSFISEFICVLLFIFSPFSLAAVDIRPLPALVQTGQAVMHTSSVL